MHFELSRTFPAARASGFEYMTDLATWHDWSPICVPDDQDVKFSARKDLIAYRYRPMAIPISGKMHLVKVKEGELWKLRFEQPAFSDVMMTWEFENAGAHAFTLTVTVDIDDAGWWDKTYQWMSMVPWVIKRDVQRAMDALHRHFAHADERVEVKAAS